MYKVFGDTLSGNCYKIKLLMHLLDIPYEWEHVDILQGGTQTETFKEMNLNAKIPLLLIDNSQHLAESNAILNYLADSTDFLPNSKFPRAQVLQWQFFEQYSHEPYIAVARYINKYLGLPKEREAEYYAKQEGGYKALDVLEYQLGNTAFLVGDLPTIADISLYAYTHVAYEGGFDLSGFANIKTWFKRIETLPGYISMQ